MVDIVAIGRLSGWLLKKERGDDCCCLERYRLNGGPFPISCIETAETLCEMFAALSAWELEDVLSPFCGDFISTIDIFDELR